jgi:broad specificity phosphatase PhoE
MAEILLVRHGRPQCDHATRIRGGEFGTWVACYDDAPLDKSLKPAPELLERVSGMRCIVTSTLRRSVESASILAPGRPVVSEALFKEAGIPTALPFRVPLSPGAWDALARAAWLLGVAAGDESFRKARTRAAHAATRLVDLARQHGKVALVGHGMLNTLIARRLRAVGWTGTGNPRAYWGCVALQNSTP